MGRGEEGTPGFGAWTLGWLSPPVTGLLHLRANHNVSEVPISIICSLKFGVFPSFLSYNTHSLSYLLFLSVQKEKKILL